jgi:hypothetical protein
MATVISRYLCLSTDGRVCLFEVYDDHTSHLVIPPRGASGQIAIDDCTEGLYDRHGTLVVGIGPEAE